MRAALDDATPAFARPIMIGRQALLPSAPLERDLLAEWEQASQLGRANLAQESELAGNKVRLGDLEASLAARNTELAQSETLVADLKNILAAREAELAQNKTRLGDIEDSLAARNAELARSETLVADLKSIVAAREAKLAQNRARLDDLEGSLAVREAELKEKIARIEDLAASAEKLAGRDAELVRREAFEQVGRFDEDLPCAFNDVDLCIKLRQNEWRIIWTPAAELYHHESLTFGPHSDADRAEQFRRDVHTIPERWPYVLDADPFYGPNLALDPANQFGFAFRPRINPTSLIAREIIPRVLRMVQKRQTL